MRVLIVGRGFLGSNLERHIRSDCRIAVSSCSHNEILQVDFDGYDCVLSACLHPSFFTERYTESIDVDLTIAKRLVERSFGGRFYSLGSRRVYGKSEELVFHSEQNSQKLPLLENYSKNKAASETNISRTSLNFCILRLSNVFGAELGRSTFFGTMISSAVRNGKITMSISPTTRRDFLPVSLFAEMVAKLILQNSDERIVNIGSGIAIQIGKLVEVFSAEFEKANRPLEITFDNVANDQFGMDVSLFREITGSAPARLTDILEAVRTLGNFYAKRW